MILYLLIIGIGTVVISVCTAIWAAPVYGFAWWEAIIFTVMSVIIIIAFDGIVALITRFFPQKNYDPYKWWFKEKRGERKLYEMLGIRKWKDKIPEMGGLLAKFGKTKVEQKNNPEYLYMFLCETGFSEIMHIISLFAGYLVVFCLPLEYALLFGIPTATVNFFLQLLPIPVQRYTRAKMVKAYERALKYQTLPTIDTKQEKQKENETEK